MGLFHTIRHDEVPGAQSTHSIRYNDSVVGEDKSNTTLEWKVQMTSGQWLIVSCLYTVGFWICKRATPGKRIIRAKIIDARTGGWPTNAQFLVRYIGYIILALPLWLGFIWVSLPLCLGFIWAAFDKRKQGWHDKIARTIVIDG